MHPPAQRTQVHHRDVRVPPPTPFPIVRTHALPCNHREVVAVWGGTSIPAGAPPQARGSSQWTCVSRCGAQHSITPSLSSVCARSICIVGFTLDFAVRVSCCPSLGEFWRGDTLPHTLSVCRGVCWRLLTSRQYPCSQPIFSPWRATLCKQTQ